MTESAADVTVTVAEVADSIRVSVRSPGRWPVTICAPRAGGQEWLLAALRDGGEAADIPDGVTVHIEVPLPGGAREGK